MKSRLFAVMLLFCLLLGGCSAPVQSNEPVEIEVYHLSLGMKLEEYRIDLTGGKLWGFHGSEDDFEERDSSLENQGYTLLGELSKDAIKEFLNDLDPIKIANWEPAYESEEAICGHYWGITFRYGDGSEKAVTGREAYPPGWDALFDATETLTGVRILKFKTAE